MSTGYEVQQRMLEAAKFQNAKASFLIQVYKQHLDYVVCMANDHLLVQIVADYAGDAVIPTLQLFEDAIAYQPELVKDISRQHVAVIHDQVIAEYLDLLEQHSRQTPATLRLEKAKMQNMTLLEARERLSALKLRQKMSAQPITELKQIVRDAHEQSYGYPTLPKSIWQNGGFVAITPEYLRSVDVYELKRLNRIYGIAAVNARLNGR